MRRDRLPEGLSERHQLRVGTLDPRPGVRRMRVCDRWRGSERAIQGQGRCRQTGLGAGLDTLRAVVGFTGGTIARFAGDVPGEPYIDLEREGAAMMMRE